MRKKKIIFNGIILLLLILSVGLGIMSIFMGDRYKNNKVSFVVDKAHAYCRIEATYFYNGQIQNDKTYSKAYEYGQDLSQGGFEGFPAWDLGTSMFDVEYSGATPETFSYVIKISNLNPDRDLCVTLADIAVGEKIKSNKTVMCFYTTITCDIGGTSSSVLFSNKEGEEANEHIYTSGQKLVDINSETIIPIGSYITIKVEIERKTRVEAFEFANNFKINISAKEESDK